MLWYAVSVSYMSRMVGIAVFPAVSGNGYGHIETNQGSLTPPFATYRRHVAAMRRPTLSASMAGSILTFEAESNPRPGTQSP